MTIPSVGIGYPSYFQTQATPSAAAMPWLNQQFGNDFGLPQAPIYNLNMNANAGYGMGGGMGMGMGGYGMGMMYPGYSKSYLNYINMDYKDRLAYDHEYNQSAREFNQKEGRASKQFAALEDGETGNTSLTCRSLQTAIADGDTDQVVREFDRIVGTLKTSPIYDKLKKEGAYTEDQIELQLRETAFRQFQAATGQDVTKMLEMNCDSSLENGFFNTLSFGHGQRYSKEEMISHLYGKPIPKSTQLQKTAGKAAGVMTYAAAGAVLGCVVGGPIGGAIVGGIIGLIGACA